MGIALVRIEHEDFARTTRSSLTVSPLSQTVIHVFLKVSKDLTWRLLPTLLVVLGGRLIGIRLLLIELIRMLGCAIRVEHGILKNGRVFLCWRFRRH